MTENILTEKKEQVLEKVERVIDKHYQMLEAEKATEIIQKAMDLAREEIPKGAVATYIPNSAKWMPISWEYVCIRLQEGKSAWEIMM